MDEAAGAEEPDGGSAGAGQDCPARQSIGVAGATEEELAAITRLLQKRAESAPAGVGPGRAGAMAWAAVKVAAVVFMAAGVVGGLGDGDEFDSGGCPVAHQPGKSPRRERPTGAGERTEGKVPGSGGGDGDGPGDGGPDEMRSGPCGRPPCGVDHERHELHEKDFTGRNGGNRGGKRDAVRSEEVVDGGGGTAKYAEDAERGAVVRAVDPPSPGYGAVLAAMERFEEKLEVVARGNFELRRENEELRTLHGEGFFKFALRVDGEDFRAFAVIMALGNRKAAADFLEVPHRSFYDRVEKWPGRGRDYQRMARFIDWRKRSSRRIKLRLEDSVQSGEPNDESENPETVRGVLDAISAGDNRDYPAVLAQVMEALKAQNVKNWPAVRDELVGMIREEVAQ
jgi:hypothetical protein